MASEIIWENARLTLGRRASVILTARCAEFKVNRQKLFEMYLAFAALQGVTLDAARRQELVRDTEGGGWAALYIYTPPQYILFTRILNKYKYSPSEGVRYVILEGDRICRDLRLAKAIPADTWGQFELELFPVGELNHEREIGLESV